MTTIHLDPQRVTPILQAALKEDIGARDLTTGGLIHPKAAIEAEIVARETGVVAGIPIVEWTFGLLDKRIRVKPMVKEGDAVQPEKALVFLEGPARPILSGERTALNFLSHLSGIATLTRAFVERAKPYPARILDTRKTTPNLRLLEKYAVAVGGGHNHRMGLYDQVLIKESHLQVLLQQRRGQSPATDPAGRPSGTVPLGGHAEVIAEALTRCQAPGPIFRSSIVNRQSSSVSGARHPIEIEVRSLDEFRAALGAGASLILLDNMPVDEIGEAVRIKRRLTRKVWLEASGGVTLETVNQVAATGVDYISIGALTRDAPGLDVALEVV